MNQRFHWSLGKEYTESSSEACKRNKQERGMEYIRRKGGNC